MSALILAPSRSAALRAGLHQVVIFAVLATSFAVLGWTACAYTSPAPVIRCAMIGEG